MTFEPVGPHYVEKVRLSFARQRFMHFLAAKLMDVRSGYCEIHLPYRKELTQQHGYFHAGVISTLADNTSGYAAYTLMLTNSSVLTVEFKLNLLAPGRGEVLISREDLCFLNLCQISFLGLYIVLLGLLQDGKVM